MGVLGKRGVMYRGEQLKGNETTRKKRPTATRKTKRKMHACMCPSRGEGSTGGGGMHSFGVEEM